MISKIVHSIIQITEINRIILNFKKVIFGEKPTNKNYREHKIMYSTKEQYKMF